MPLHELRDPADARTFLLQGLWLQRVLPPRGERVRAVLEWAMETAGAGEALPPIGLLADLGHLLFGPEQVTHGARPAGSDSWGLLGEGLARTYEDYVLGKLYADWTFERAGDALRRYQGRDRARALAFLVEQLRQRAGMGGVLLSPAVIKAILDQPGDELLADGWQSLQRDGPLPLLRALYEQAVAGVRNLAEVLGPEDVFELEHGTAVAAFGQRLALRQVLQAAARFEAALPQRRPRTAVRKHEVPTRVLDEDTYPVGGFSSLSTRGSIESLLHSQLVYMEKAERPDLFDIKFLRDELLYYARDENQFLRRRRTFLFALDPDLVRARFKDAELPFQRIVLLLAYLLAAVRRLIDWLSADALSFEFLFLQDETSPPNPPLRSREGGTGGVVGQALADEQALLEMLLREQIANGTVTLERLPRAQLASRCLRCARRSLCHCLMVGMADRPLDAEVATVSRLCLREVRPGLVLDGETLPIRAEDDAMTVWVLALETLLESCLD